MVLAPWVVEFWFSSYSASAGLFMLEVELRGEVHLCKARVGDPPLEDPRGTACGQSAMRRRDALAYITPAARDSLESCRCSMVLTCAEGSGCAALPI